MVGDAIPYPWRVANFVNKSGSGGQIIISQDGQLFSSLKSALEFLGKSKEMRGEEIQSFAQFIGKANYEEKLAEDFWIPDLTLPEGWRKLKKSDDRYTKYLAPSGETFSTRTAAIDHLKMAGVEIHSKVKVK